MYTSLNLVLLYSEPDLISVEPHPESRTVTLALRPKSVTGSSSITLSYEVLDEVLAAIQAALTTGEPVANLPAVPWPDISQEELDSLLAPYAVKKE